MSSRNPYRRVVLTVSVPAKKRFSVVSTRFFKKNSVLGLFCSCRETGLQARPTALRALRGLPDSSIWTQLS